MFDTDVNYLAILVAAVVNMGLGFLWYSPLLFGKQWMKLVKLDEKSLKAAQKKMGALYAVTFAAVLVTGYILSVLIRTTQVLTVAEGIQLSAVIWLGFVTTTQYTDVVFGGKPLKLYFINTGYQLTALILMAGIISMWL